MELRLLVLSDPHVQGELPDSSSHRESWWAAGEIAKHRDEDPVDSMLEMVAKESVAAQAIIVPGDVCHKASETGFKVGWERLRLLAYELGNVPLIGTMGNHDCASKERSSDPFSFARRLPQFPVRNPSEIEEFWTKGSTITSIDKAWSVIVINSAMHHYTEHEARAGTFDAAAILALEQRLQCFKGKVQMAVLHHHPIVHSNRLADSSEVLPTGDDLLDVLGSNGVKWVIHGHRHEPRFRRGPKHDLVVFAAGSFSIALRELSPITRNLLHFVKLELEGDLLRGEVRSWEFNRGYGWSRASTKSARIPHVARFASPRPSLDTLTNAVEASTKAKTPQWLSWKQAVKAHPELLNLTPDELDEVTERLRVHRSIQPELDEWGHLHRWTSGDTCVAGRVNDGS
ncbi:MAG: metallophosphoesterase [Gemmatimonadetes bacterium]|nr:metallophosphoesterase [Gemmatimonadota bacterium]